MPGGPAALAVALVLLPGWIFSRLEARPRTSQTALSELFEVVTAGALTTGFTALLYVVVLNLSGGTLGSLRLVDPTLLSKPYVHAHLMSVCLTAAVVVTVACALAGTSASIQRRRRLHKDGANATYKPEVPIWVSMLGGKDDVVTIETRDARRITGYLGAYSVDDDGAPTINLTPPIIVATQERSALLGRGPTKTVDTGFSSNEITIPGSEVVAVWTSIRPGTK